MQLLGANPSPRVAGIGELPAKSHYFIGNDPEKWRTNVPTYTKVRYQDVYPGIDVVYYGNQRELEYDFIIQSGADPNAITLGFEGLDRIELDSQGDLVLYAASGQFRLGKALVYQEVDGVRQEIPGGYLLRGNRRVAFQVGAYNTGRTLIIDPVLVYSTYLGGSSIDIARSIAVDVKGNAYVTGFTNSREFPAVNSLQPFDGNMAFISKFNADGSALIYSTFLGGTGGTHGLGIAVDGSGNTYVTGSTEAADFPTRNALQPALRGGSDAFVAKLDASGSALVYGTYLGGSSDDYVLEIAVDPESSAYVTGFTMSVNFPTRNPLQPAHAGAVTDPSWRSWTRRARRSSTPPTWGATAMTPATGSPWTRSATPT